MKLTHRCKIKDLWQHPAGHELLSQMLQLNGLSVQWIESPLVANLPAAVLDRYSFSGFAHFLLELCTTVPHNDSTQDFPHWWKDAVIYQIFLPSFMDSDHDGLGDFGGICQRLPYLSRLGVDTLWLCPVLAQGTEGGIANHRSPHKDFGSNEDFDELIAAIHRQGMRVLLDLNLSVVSLQHPWFTNILQGNGHPEYFIWKPGAPPWEASLAKNNWHYVSKENAFCLLNKGRVALNWDNASLRQEFADILQFWVKRGVDGFCFGGLTQLCQNMPATNFGPSKALPDRNFFDAYHMRLQHHLHELALALPQDILLLGKLDGQYVCTQTCFMSRFNPTELGLLYSTAHLHTHANDASVLSLQHFRRFTLALSKPSTSNALTTLFWENHQHPRILAQLSSCASYHGLLAKLLATWLLCMHGTPILYQGEELGLCGASGDNSAYSSRAPFPWSSGFGGGFSGASPWLHYSLENQHLHAAGQMENPRSVWHHHAKLIALRRQHVCLTHGSFKPVFTNNRKVLCFFRIYGAEKCYVEMNLSEKQIPRPGRISLHQHLLLSNYECPSKYLRPYEANVYLCENS